MCHIFISISNDQLYIYIFFPSLSNWNDRTKHIDMWNFPKACFSSILADHYQSWRGPLLPFLLTMVYRKDIQWQVIVHRFHNLFDCYIILPDLILHGWYSTYKGLKCLLLKTPTILGACLTDFHSGSTIFHFSYKIFMRSNFETSVYLRN